MTDRDLLLGMHQRMDQLAEDFASHLGEHKALVRLGKNRLQWLSTLASWVGAAVAISALLAR
jgi:hypothetical protein